MTTTSRAAAFKVAPEPWRRPRSRHTLLRQMAQDAEKIAAQAERLRDFKIQQRFKFREVAEAVEVTERQVQRWFAGDSDIEPDNLKALAEFLETTPDFIEYGEQQRSMHPPSLLDAFDTDDELRERLERIEAKIDQLLSQTPATAADDDPAAAIERELEEAAARDTAHADSTSTGASGQKRKGRGR